MTRSLHLDSELKLSEGLDERHPFDVSDSSAQLNDAHFRLDVALDGLLCDALNPFLNCICDMWHN